MGLILRQFYAIPAERIGLYLLPFAIGNFLGPLLLGRLFDSIGRKPMIAFTYAASGVLLAVTAWMFAQGMLDATGQTIAWMVIFFFASAAASSAYLTVSESFRWRSGPSPLRCSTCWERPPAASSGRGCSAAWSRPGRGATSSSAIFLAPP